ncbi:RNA recognition motif domain-containing protein [Ditylenchus destructor]|nr:RNA recognition motif domain-containing protein [Ditylenchus destructor]
MSLHLLRTPKLIHTCANFGIACRAHHKLYLGDLSRDITEEKLRSQCEEFGRVSDIRFSDESKTNAYVSFEKPGDMSRAMEPLRKIAKLVSPVQSIRRQTSKPAPLTFKEAEKNIPVTSSRYEPLKETEEKCSSYNTSSIDETLEETRFTSLPQKDRLARRTNVLEVSPAPVSSSKTDSKVLYYKDVTPIEEPFARRSSSKSFPSRSTAATAKKDVTIEKEPFACKPGFTSRLAAQPPALPRKSSDTPDSCANENIDKPVCSSTRGVLKSSRNNTDVPVRSSTRAAPIRFSNNTDMVNYHEQPDFRPAEMEDEYCLLFEDLKLDTTDEYFKRLYHRFGIRIYRDYNKGNRTLSAYVSFDSHDSLDTASKDKNPSIKGSPVAKQSFVPKCLKLFVYGLSSMTDDPDIRKYFTRFGRCEVEIVKDPQLDQKTKTEQMQQSRTKNAVVVFSRPEEVLRAMSHNKPHIIDGHLVSIHPCISVKRTIIVSGIPQPDMTISSLKAYFSKFGSVLTCEAPQDPNFQHCAYVTFFSAEEANEAMATIPHIINGHTCDTIRYRHDWKTRPMSQEPCKTEHKEGEKEQKTKSKKYIRTVRVCSTIVMAIFIIYAVCGTDAIQNALKAETKAVEDVHRHNKKNNP